MAYAMLAQAPRNTFAAALTLGFCPNLDMQKTAVQGLGARVRYAAPAVTAWNFCRSRISAIPG